MPEFFYRGNTSVAPVEATPLPGHGEVYSIQHVIKFVSDLRQVGGFHLVLGFSPPIKPRHDITEIFLKVALNAILL